MRYIIMTISLILSFNLLINEPAQGQTASFEELENKASQHLNNKNFEKAYSLYSELMVYFPTDPEVSYGYGVSGVQSGKYDQKVREALQESIKKSSSDDAYLYLAKAYHANEAWEKAKKYYTKFEKVAPKKLRKKFYTQKLMDLCDKKNNPFSSSHKNEVIADLNLSQQQESELPDQKLSSNIDEIIPQNESKDFFNHSSMDKQKLRFQVNDAHTYSNLSNFETEEGRTEFIHGWTTQMEIDSIEKTLKGNRLLFDSEDDNYQKELLASKIISLEKESDLLQNKKQVHYEKALGAEQKFWNQQPDLKSASTAPTPIPLISLPMRQKEDTVISLEEVPSPETAIIPPTNNPVVATTNSDILIPTPKSELEAETKIETVVVDPIPISLPEITFRIQISAFKESLSPDALSSFELEYPNEVFSTYSHNGYFCLTIAEETEYNNALSILQKYKAAGSTSLFIVAFKDSKRIPIKEALK